MDRKYYEQEIYKILEDCQNKTESASDYYRNKTIDMLVTITDEIYLQKIYNFVLGFTLEQL